MKTRNMMTLGMEGLLGGARFQRAVFRILRKTPARDEIFAGSSGVGLPAAQGAPQDAEHGTQGCARHLAGRLAGWFGFSVFLSALWGVSASAEDKSPPPDPAAHTVIVPYDAKVRPDAAKADRFYLGYADFQRLWDLAKENRRPAKPVLETGAPAAFINTALYEAEVLDASLRVKARLQVVTRGAKWAKLALPFKSAGALTIGEVMLDGHAAAFQDGAVLIEEPGAHTVEVALEIARERQWKNVSLDVPPSSVAMLRLSVPSGDGRPDFGRSAAAVTEESREGRRIFTLPVTGESVLNLTRTPLQRLVADAPPAQVETRAVLRVQPRMERLSAEVAFQFAGTERRALMVELDPTLQLESATAAPAGVVTLRREGGKQWLDVAFQPGAAGSATVNVNAFRVFSEQEAVGGRPAPLVRGVAVRETASMELLSTADLLVKPDAATDAERIESTTAAGSGELVAGAWRLRPGAALRYVVSQAEDRSLAKLETLHQLTRQKAEIISAISLDSGREALADARIAVPAGFEVQALTGPRLVSWHREGDELSLRFDAQPLREARLVLHLAKSVEQPAASWMLEPLRLPRFVKHEETVLIATHAAEDVKLSFDGADRKMREEDVNEVKSVIGVKEPLRLKRALRVEKAQWSAIVGLTRQVPRFSADAVLLAQAGDLGLRLSQQVGINIEQGAVAGVKLRLPAALPEARVHGAAVRDAQSRVNGAVREYDVTFQTEVLDRADFTMDMDLPLEGEKILPVLQVDGASHARRFVIVDNAGTREMKLDSGGADAAAKESVPYLPDGLTRPAFFRAADKSAVKLTFTQLESTAGNAAIVTLAEITTALRPNGERWETVVYSLSNRSLQFLPVSLPQGAELVEVSVGGRTVRADRREKGEGKREADDVTEFLVPLIQMRAGELSQQVRLVYRVPPGREGVEMTHGLDDPELVGLSAERTLWNVWVPGGYEARKFDGNMEDVGEEGTELEKQQSLLSEVSRLNRLLSSKEVSYEDAKLAQDNANKALEEVRQKVTNKKRSFYDAQEGKVAKNAGVVSQLDAEVSKQLEEQGRLLTANSINAPVFSDARKAQVQSDDVAGQQVFSVQRRNQWDFNSEAAGKKEAAPARREAAQADSMLVNDQTLVSNGFFKAGDGVIILNKSGAGTLNLTAGGTVVTDAPQIPQQAGVQANVNFNNARANGLSQQSQGVISGTGGVSMPASGATTLSGANTYSGAVVVNGGTLQVMNGEQALRLQEPGAETRQRTDSLRDQQRGAMLNQVDRTGGIGGRGTQQSPAPVASPAAPAKPEERAKRNAGKDEDDFTVQLKPVGRVSLTVEVPLEGTAFHFRKLKDHATLEVKVRKAWDVKQSTAWWVLGAGLGCALLAAWLRRWRASRAGQMAAA